VNGSIVKVWPVTEETLRSMYSKADYDEDEIDKIIKQVGGSDVMFAGDVYDIRDLDQDTVDLPEDATETTLKVVDDSYGSYSIIEVHGWIDSDGQRYVSNDVWL